MRNTSLLSAALLLAVALTSYANPIPQPKEKVRPTLAGNWIVHWSGSEWPTVLLEDGTYVAERPGGPRYEGRWTLSGDKLTIEERLNGPTGYGQVYRYTFTLCKDRFQSTCGKLRFVKANK